MQLLHFPPQGSGRSRYRHKPAAATAAYDGAFWSLEDTKDGGSDVGVDGVDEVVGVDGVEGVEGVDVVEGVVGVGGEGVGGGDGDGENSGGGMIVIKGGLQMETGKFFDEVENGGVVKVGDEEGVEVGE